MIDKKQHNRGENECPALETNDSQVSNTASLWNSPLGRRAFLKKTGAATVATAVAIHGLRVQVQAQATGGMKKEIVSTTYTRTTYAIWNTQPSGQTITDWQQANFKLESSGLDAAFTDPDPTGLWQGPKHTRAWVDEDAQVISTYFDPQVPCGLTQSAPYQRADGKWVVRFRYTETKHFNWQ